MRITVNRNENTFTPQLADRINVKTTAIYDALASIETTPIYPKLSVETFDINTVNIPIVSYVENNSFCIGGHLYLINCKIVFKEEIKTTHYVEVARITTPPNIDIFLQYDDMKYIYKIEKGTQSVYLYGNPGKEARLYFYYIV